MNAHMPARRRRLLYVGAAFVAISALVSVAIIASGIPFGDDQPASQEHATSNFLELMALIPDRPETRFDLTLMDYERGFSLLGLERPKRFASDDEEAAYRLLFLDRFVEEGLGFVSSDVARPSVIGGLLWPVSPQEDVGFSLPNIDGYAIAGRDLEAYEAAVGDFDQRLVTGKISSCPNCGMTAERRNHGGLEYYAWGEDFRQHLRIRFEAPAFDDLGRAGRLAASSRFVLRTLWDEGIERMIDAATGSTPSLADNEDFALIAHALDVNNAISAYVTDCNLSRSRISAWLDNLTPSAAAASASAAWETPSTETILAPYRVYGIASAFDDDGSGTLLLLVHETPELAEANVDRLRYRLGTVPVKPGGAMLSEIYSDVRITVEGRLLIAQLSGHGLPKFTIYGSPVLLHE
jgi:hypothetical protein